MVSTLSNPFDTQVGGSHYKSLSIQPMEYALKNGLNFAQSNAVKYVTRYNLKNGIEDLRKAIHNIELLIKYEEDKAYGIVGGEGEAEVSSEAEGSRPAEAFSKEDLAFAKKYRELLKG